MNSNEYISSEATQIIMYIKKDHKIGKNHDKIKKDTQQSIAHNETWGRQDQINNNLVERIYKKLQSL